MLFTHTLRKVLFKYAYLEAIVLMSLFFFIGYMTNPADVCMLEHKLSLLTIILTIITLFHGISSGLVAIMMLGVAMNVAYEQFLYQDFLNEFVLVLIFGEFHYYWNRTISKHSAEVVFTKLKLSELSTAFYMLKISHDQVEKSYVLKPMSLRNSIRTIKDNFYQGKDEESYTGFLSLLQKTLHIDKAYLTVVHQGHALETKAKTHALDTVDERDLMIQDVFAKKMPIYASSDDRFSQSKYLAVIPALIEEEVVGLFVIEKMPFMSFNKDNLISVSILLTYLFDELYKINIVKNMGSFFLNFQENFRFELYRLYTLHQTYKIGSTVLVIKSFNKLNTHLLTEQITKSLRSLDIMSHMTLDEKDTIAILFPFSDVSSAQSFVERINTYVKMEDTETLTYSSFNISDKDLISEYLVRIND